MLYLFLLGRILLGGYLLMNAYKHFANLKGYTAYAKSKGVPMPEAAVGVTGIMLLLGGLAIFSGYYSQIGAILVAIFLFGTSFMMHRYWEIKDPMQRMGENINFYKNLGLAGAVLMIIFLGNISIADVINALIGNIAF